MMDIGMLDPKAMFIGILAAIHSPWSFPGAQLRT
jgi:hypothetical protein